MLGPSDLSLSGERIVATYVIAGTEAEARARAEDLCFEQTVELPADLVPDGAIRDQIVGRVEAIVPRDESHFAAEVSFAVETGGGELTQLLNLLFGNSSIKPGIRLERFSLPDSSLRSFSGPRFGLEGLRERLGVLDRPLLATALKPMGLPPEELANLAYAFARGGIDLIKDDHGLADQTFCPFGERVDLCAEAVARANAETGERSIYVANVTAPADVLHHRIERAKRAGAGGLLVAPGLLGWDVMRQLAADDTVDLPLVMHPALMGSFVVSPDSGIGHAAIFGQVARLAGADATIFPNFGGRFAFTRTECEALAEACATPMGHLRPIFPVPAGGMSLERVPQMLEIYGRDVMLLIGGDLHRRGPDLSATCRALRQVVETSAEGTVLRS